MTKAGQNERRTTFESTKLDSAGERPAWLSVWRDSRAASRGLSAGEMLDRYPELKFRKSVVLSMAYDEYCRREAAGEAVDRREFCQAFPGHQESVARLLSVYQYLKERDWLPDEAALEENWPEAGETIAGFHLLDGLGLGAFARVYIAEEPAVAHRRVVVKVSAEGAGEVDVLGKLSHPNIVQILSVQQDEERHWTLISMPYLGQATLDDVIWQLFSAETKRPLKACQLLDVVEKINSVGVPPEPAEPDPLLAKGPYVDGVVHLLAQLADALAYTHAKGICHRDLKPSNVLFAAGGKPMLLDFNLAQDEQAAGRRLGGTLPYMAPEQLNSIVIEPEAGPPSIDPRSDLFSLAVIGYELLCGVWPYGAIPAELTQDEFAIELFERQRSGPTALIERNPQIGADVSALFQRCLSFDIESRPQTAAEMAAQLRRCLSPWRRAKRWARRRRRLVACTTTAFLSLAAWAGYFLATLPPYGERELRKATAALERRDLTTAIGHLNEAATYLPPESKTSLADAYFRVGKAAFDAKDYGLAVEHFTHAINRGLDTQDVWFYRGAAYYRQHLEATHHLAVKDFLAAIRTKPGTWTLGQLSACMADSEMSTNGAAAAQSSYSSAVNYGYKTLAVLNNKGLAHTLSGQPRGFSYKAAEECLTEGLETALADREKVDDATLLALYYNRAMNEQRWAQNQQRRCNDLSKQDIQRAIALAPKRYLSRLMAADIYQLHAAEGEPDWQIAVDHMREGIRLGAPRSLTTLGPFRTALTEAVRAQPGGEALLAAQPEEASEPLPNRLHVLDDLLR